MASSPDQLQEKLFERLPAATWSASFGRFAEELAAIAQAPSQQAACGLAADLAASLSDCDRAIVFVRESASRWRTAAHNFPEVAAVVDASDPPAILQAGEILRHPDLVAYARGKPRLDAIIRAGMRNCISAGVKCGHEIGFVTAYNRGPVRYDDEQLTLLSLIGMQLSLALARDRVANQPWTGPHDDQALTAQLREHGDEHAADAMHFLLGVSEVLASSADVRTALKRLAELAVPRVADACIIFLTDAAGEPHRAAVAHVDPGQATHIEDILHRIPLPREGHLRRALQSEAPILLPDIDDAILRQNIGDERQLAEIRRLGMRSAMLLALRARGRTFGALVFWYTEAQRAFSEADVTLAQLIAKRIAVAVDNARLLEQERRSAQRLQFIAEATKALTASLDLRTTLDTLLEISIPQMADWGIINLVQEDGSYQLLSAKHRNPALQSLLDGLRGHSLARPESSIGTPVVLKTGAPQVYPAISKTELEELVGPTRLPLVEQLGCEAIAFLPLRTHGQVLGALTFAWTGRPHDNQFDVADLPLFEELAARAASAILHAQLYEHQHRVAETLQRAFLPDSFPATPGLRFDAVYSAGHSESDIGGDWYDAFELSDGRLFVSVGDVAGRGLSAAITMGKMRQALRSFALDHADLNELLNAANNSLRLETAEGMVTAVVCIIDPDEQTLEYALAGHPWPFLRMPDGEVIELSGDGIPLGVRSRLRVGTRSVPFPVGAFLVCYTDGLTESTHNVFEGEQRLRAALQQTDVLDSEHPAQALLNAVVGDRQHSDDVAVLTIHMTHSFPGKLELQLPAIPASAHRVRHALRAFTRDLGVSQDKDFEIQVAVGEAVNNVIEHAYGAAEGDVWVTVSSQGNRLVVEIADQGSWRLPRDDHGGRGLRIIENLCQNLTVHFGQGRSYLRLEFELHDPMTLPTP